MRRSERIAFVDRQAASRTDPAPADVPTDERAPEAADTAPHIEMVAVDGETGRVLPEVDLTMESLSSIDLKMRIGAPEGYVADASEFTAGGPRSRFAERVRVVVPLRREADVRLRVVNAEGRPVEGAVITGASMAGPEPSFDVVALEDVGEIPECNEDVEVEVEEAGSPVWWRAEPTDRMGWTRVRGIPHLFEEHFWITAGDGVREAATGLALGAFGERYAAEVRLPREPSMRAQSLITLSSFG